MCELNAVMALAYVSIMWCRGALLMVIWYCTKTCHDNRWSYYTLCIVDLQLINSSC